MVWRPVARALGWVAASGYLLAHGAHPVIMMLMLAAVTAAAFDAADAADAALPESAGVASDEG